VTTEREAAAGAAALNRGAPVSAFVESINDETAKHVVLGLLDRPGVLDWLVARCSVTVAGRFAEGLSRGRNGRALARWRGMEQPPIAWDPDPGQLFKYAGPGEEIVGVLVTQGTVHVELEPGFREAQAQRRIQELEEQVENLVRHLADYERTRANVVLVSPSDLCACGKAARADMRICDECLRASVPG
jgi:hypothetical protein